MQHGIHEHGTVPVGHNEAVTVDPGGVLRVVLEEVVPQHFGDVSHAHGRSWMPAGGFLYRIHTEDANGISEFYARWHGCENSLKMDYSVECRYRSEEHTSELESRGHVEYRLRPR